MCTGICSGCSPLGLGRPYLALDAGRVGGDFMVVTADWLVPLVLGEAYSKAAPILRCLAWTTPALFATNVVGRALGAVGRQRITLYIVGVAPC